MHNQDMIAILQASLTPVILISGIALLLLNMTNRISKPLDRIRFLGSELKTSTQHNQHFYFNQINILYKRCQILQKSITFAVISIFCATIIILIIFLMTLYSADLIILIDILFITGLCSLMISLILFLIDVKASLDSVRIEMDRLISAYPDFKLD